MEYICKKAWFVFFGPYLSESLWRKNNLYICLVSILLLTRKNPNNLLKILVIKYVLQNNGVEVWMLATEIQVILSENPQF